LALLLAVVFPVHAQSAGVLEGQVVNGTAGGPQVGAGMAVTLHVVQGGAELDALRTTTDAGGRFRFDNLDTDPALSYALDAVYLDVTYGSAEPYKFEGVPSSLSAQLFVFETTEDPANLRVDSVHIIAESLGPVLRLTEVYLLGNQGDRTYIGKPDPAAGGRPTTAFIPLPAGAVGLAFQDGESPDRYVEVEGGLRDTQPVPPGVDTSVARFSFHLTVDGATVPLEHKFAYPVSRLNLLAAQPGLTVRGQQLQAQGPQGFGDKQFEVYLAEDLGPNTPLNVELVPVAAEEGSSMIPSASGSEPGVATAAPQGQQKLLRSLGVGLTLLAAIGAGVYPRLTRRTAAQAARDRSTVLQGALAKQLLADLADLEQAFEAGEVDQSTYVRLRAEKYRAISDAAS
jgi:hypothetical protein